MILNYTYYKRKMYFSKTTLLTVTKHNRLLSILVPHNTYRLTFASAKPLCLRCTTSFFIRHMWKTPLNGVHQVTKNGVLALGKFSTPHAVGNSRRMSYLHAGTLKKKLKKTVLDDSGKHKIVTETTCKDSKCLQKNCATSDDNCPYQNAQQHQQNIPVTGGKAAFKTSVIGNMTSKMPPNKKGAVVDQAKNYSGIPKKQEPKHHDAINKALHHKNDDT